MSETSVVALISVGITGAVAITSMVVSFLQRRVARQREPRVAILTSATA